MSEEEHRDSGQNGDEPPTRPDRQRDYASIAATYHEFVRRELPALKESVDETKAAAIVAAGRAELALEASRRTEAVVVRLEKRFPSSPPPTMARAHAPLAEYDPELTPAYGTHIRLPVEKWQQLEVDRAHEKGLTEGAERALSKLRERVKFWWPIATGVLTVAAGVVGWLLRHVQQHP